jgi:preprotein translocase subunit SecA
MDFLWKDHLTMMDELREAVKLRAYGQKDPLTEYKKDGHLAFRELMQTIETEIADRILKVRMAKTKPISQRIVVRENIIPGEKKVEGEKVGRNDPCPCGAKRADGQPMKYKNCCGK